MLSAVFIQPRGDDVVYYDLLQAGIPAPRDTLLSLKGLISVMVFLPLPPPLEAY